MEWVLKIILILVAALVVGLVLSNWKRIAGWGGALRRFYHEVMIEMKKVSWPSRDEVVNSTILVGVSTVFLVVLIGSADWVLGKFVGILFGVQK